MTTKDLYTKIQALGYDIKDTCKARGYIGIYKNRKEVAKLTTKKLYLLSVDDKYMREEELVSILDEYTETPVDER